MFDNQCDPSHQRPGHTSEPKPGAGCVSKDQSRRRARMIQDTIAAAEIQQVDFAGLKGVNEASIQLPFRHSPTRQNHGRERMDQGMTAAPDPSLVGASLTGAISISPDFAVSLLSVEPSEPHPKALGRWVTGSTASALKFDASNVETDSPLLPHNPPGGTRCTPCTPTSFWDEPSRWASDKNHNASLKDLNLHRTSHDSFTSQSTTWALDNSHVSFGSFDIDMIGIGEQYAESL